METIEKYLILDKIKTIKKYRNDDGYYVIGVDFCGKNNGFIVRLPRILHNILEFMKTQDENKEVIGIVTVNNGDKEGEALYAFSPIKEKKLKNSIKKISYLFGTNKTTKKIQRLIELIDPIVKYLDNNNNEYLVFYDFINNKIIIILKNSLVSSQMNLSLNKNIRSAVDCVIYQTNSKLCFKTTLLRNNIGMLEKNLQKYFFKIATTDEE